MTWQTIEKPRSGWGVRPNMPDYEEARRAFTWEWARSELNGSMEFLNFVAALAEDTGLEIPERDYPRDRHPRNGCVAYVENSQAASFR
jgi:hypothetical protein